MQQSHFSETAIREQLFRIQSTLPFSNSSVLSGFLQFIVDEALLGHEKQLKEYTIAVNVLSRGSDFNPQFSGVVRIHAHRLRRALNEYYYEKGKHDLIRIHMPKGGYIPFFSAQNTFSQSPQIREEIKVARSRPVVAIFPFRNISKNSDRDFFAEGLGEQLSTELTRFHELAVISYYSSRQMASQTNSIKEAGVLLGAKYIATGSIQNDKQHLRVTAQLILAESGEQLWAKSFEKSNTASGLFEIQNEIVKDILNAIGGYYGVIFKDVLKAASYQASEMKSYDAVFLYYSFQKDWNGENLHKTIKALEAAVNADPEYALAWAMLADLYPNDAILKINKIDKPVDLALKCGLRAVKIDPGCQHGYASLAWTYLFYQNREECLKAIDRCIAVNPNASDMTGAMGFLLTCAGEFDRGFTLLNYSNENNPYSPWWFELGYVFYFLSKKDYYAAWLSVEKIDKPEIFWDPLLKAVIYAYLDRTPEASTNLQLLNKLIPEGDHQDKSVIESFVLSADLKSQILEGLNKSRISHEIMIDKEKVSSYSRS